MNQPDEWLTTPEAAAYLETSIRNIYRLIDSGVLPAFKKDGVIVIRRRDADALPPDGCPDEPPGEDR